MADTYCTRHKSRWHLVLEAFFYAPALRMRRARVAPCESEKARVRVFLAGAFWSGYSFKVRTGARAAGRERWTLKLDDKGFCNRPTLEPLTCCGISKWGSDGSVLQEENLFVGRFWDCALLAD